jgi:AraC-like DNA-binding protein
VLALATSGEWRRHVLHTLRSCAIVECVPHKRWFSAATSRRPNAVIVHLDPTVFTEASLVLCLTQLRKQYGDAPLATYSDLSPAAVRLLACASRIGVAAMWLRGHDPLELNVPELIQRHGASAYVADVLDGIRPVPARIGALVSCCLRNSFARVLTVQALAGEVRIHRRTLVNRFRMAGFPPPAAFISWSRLLISARLLDDPWLSVSDIARLLHFASPSQYRGMLRRYTDFAPTALRRRGALATVVERFRVARASVQRPAELCADDASAMSQVSHRMMG